MRLRHWYVSAKPFPRPTDGFKYIERDGPFNSPVAAAEFVVKNRPVESFYQVTIHSKVTERK